MAIVHADNRFSRYDFSESDLWDILRDGFEWMPANA